MQLGGLGFLQGITPSASSKGGEMNTPLAGGATGSVGRLDSVMPGRFSSGPSFGATLVNALSDVNALQNTADVAAQKLATGDAQDIHQVLLALNHASSAFSLTLQVRNKAIDAYQEVMRMQV